MVLAFGSEGVCGHVARLAMTSEAAIATSERARFIAEKAFDQILTNTFKSR
jgi:hypothetical protein